MTAFKPDCVEQSRFDFVLEKKCVNLNRDSFNTEWHDLTHSQLVSLVKPKLFIHVLQVSLVSASIRISQSNLSDTGLVI